MVRNPCRSWWNSRTSLKRFLDIRKKINLSKKLMFSIARPFVTKVLKIMKPVCHYCIKKRRLYSLHRRFVSCRLESINSKIQSSMFPIQDFRQQICFQFFPESGARMLLWRQNMVLHYCSFFQTLFQLSVSFLVFFFK